MFSVYVRAPSLSTYTNCCTSLEKRESISPFALVSAIDAVCAPVMDDLIQRTGLNAMASIDLTLPSSFIMGKVYSAFLVVRISAFRRSLISTHSVSNFDTRGTKVSAVTVA